MAHSLDVLGVFFVERQTSFVSFWKKMMSLEPQTAVSSSQPDPGSGASSTAITSNKPQRSRWRRYSLRALLLFQVVIAVFIGYVVWRVRLIERQHAAAMEIAEHNPRGSSYKSRSVRPAWFWEPVCNFCGSSHATDVVEIMSQRHPLKESEVERLPYLEELAINRGIENDAVMKKLADSKYLKNLFVSNNRKSPPADDSIAHLRNNRSIENLTLHGAQITDKSITVLAEIPNVISLNIDQTSATSDSLEPWIKNNKLQHLRLPYKLELNVIRRLSQLTTLEVLEAFGIDEQAAKALCEFRSIQHFQFNIEDIGTVQDIAKLIPPHIKVTDNHGNTRRIP
jgi:hypothetical protein